MKIYIAGSLFSQAEQKERKFEGELIRKVLSDLFKEEYGQHITPDDLNGSVVFNPIDSPFNDKSKNPSAEEIFLGDAEEIRKSTHIFFNLDNPTDAGVFVEFGQVVELIEAGRPIYVYPIITDMRMPTAGNYEKQHIPWGINQYVIGACDNLGLTVYTSFQQALAQMVSSDIANKFITPNKENIYSEKDVVVIKENINHNLQVNEAVLMFVGNDIWTVAYHSKNQKGHSVFMRVG